MASNLLVNYPEFFEAGAIIAGIPYPCADSLIKAISCMRSGPTKSVTEMSQQVKNLNKDNLQWPRLTIWTGADDKDVNPKNSYLLARQWADLSQLSSAKETNSQGVEISRWQDDYQNTQVELVKISNMGHGLAVRPDLTTGGIEQPYLIKAPLAAAINIVHYWQLK